MSKHEPFDAVQARRPAFEPEKFAYSKSPNPDWRPGQGLNGRTDLPGYQAFVDGATPKGSQANFKHIDPEEVEDKGQLYKLMIGGIVPRPIAFCSTVSESGVMNLAPFSYFAPMGHKPPMLVVQFSTLVPISNGEGKHKDTLNNIRTTKEFVVNIISEPFIEAANFTAVNFPEDVSEWDMSGLTPIPSDTVRPPRVGESAFSMECTLDTIHDIHPDPEGQITTATIVIGRIRRFHARKDLFGPTGAIEPERLLPVARLGGISYARVTDAFQLPRGTWDEVKETPEVKDIQEKSAKRRERAASL